MLAQVLVNGVILGGLYACVAVGFSLVWGVLNVINLLHGTLVVLGGYLAWLAWVRLGLHPLLALPLVAVATGALGAVLQAGLLNPVVGAPVLITLVITFGLDLLVGNGLLLVFGADYRTIRPGWTLGTAVVHGVRIPLDRTMAATAALAMTGLLWVLLRRSWLGRAIVAVRMDRDAAALMGVRVKRVFVATFALGAPWPARRGRCWGWCFRFRRCSQRLIWARRLPCACWAVWGAWWARRRGACCWGWWRVWRRCIWGRRMPRWCRWCC